MDAEPLTDFVRFMLRRSRDLLWVLMVAISDRGLACAAMPAQHSAPFILAVEACRVLIGRYVAADVVEVAA